VVLARPGREGGSPGPELEEPRRGPRAAQPLHRPALRSSPVRCARASSTSVAPIWRNPIEAACQSNSSMTRGWNPRRGVEDELAHAFVTPQKYTRVVVVIDVRIVQHPLQVLIIVPSQLRTPAG